jgi:hypothetical protein
MRTSLVASWTRTVTSIPASVVNEMVFPEMDLIVPTGLAGDGEGDCLAACGMAAPVRDGIVAPMPRQAAAEKATWLSRGLIRNAVLDLSLNMTPRPRLAAGYTRKAV